MRAGHAGLTHIARTTKRASCRRPPATITATFTLLLSLTFGATRTALGAAPLQTSGVAGCRRSPATRTVANALRLVARAHGAARLAAAAYTIGIAHGAVIVTLRAGGHWLELAAARKARDHVTRVRRLPAIRSGSTCVVLATIFIAAASIA
jgi:hypothetical protein